MNFVWTDTTKAIDKILRHYEFGIIAGEEASEDQQKFVEVWIEPDYIDRYNKIISKIAYLFSVDEPAPHKVSNEIDLGNGLLLDKIGFFYDLKNIVKLKTVLDLIYDFEQTFALYN